MQPAERKIASLMDHGQELILKASTATVKLIVAGEPGAAHDCK
jgi:hypothetical protein